MNLLLIVGGGIAAYKAPQLVRDLYRRGVSTRVILTRGGANFTTALALGSVSGEKVFQDLFDLTDEAEMGHIQLSRAADLILVAPATANLLAKLAHGVADDLATTCLLATDAPIMVAPAMNVRMWEADATQSNMATLRARGVDVIGPDVGGMACGEWGAGRLSDPETIADAVARRIREIRSEAPGTAPDSVPADIPADLAGRRAIVTAGPTREAIDPVRYISNHSSGKQGYAVAAALAARGAEVALVSGPTALRAPPGVRRVDVESARDMLEAVEAELRTEPPADIFVGVAAVADWGVEAPSATKIKKSREGGQGGEGGAPTIAWVENPDILATVAAHARRPALVVGFAAETDHVLDHARAKRKRKGCDWILANDVSGGGPGGAVFGNDSNQLTFIADGQEESWPPGTKMDAAHTLAARAGEHFESMQKDSQT